jgi:uncharacterized membrane protein HdeD (DUF308 family)
MPNVLLFVLAIIDILSGIFLFSHASFLVRFVFYLGIICLMKGGWSLMTALTSKFYFDFLGLLDVIAGVSLILIHSSHILVFFTVIGIMMIVKGIWSMFFSVSS